MLVFEVLVWVFFGLTVGLTSDWMREHEEHPHRSTETMTYALGGALLGGMLVRILTMHLSAAFIGSYNYAGAIAAALVALVAVGLDHRLSHRGARGRMV